MSRRITLAFLLAAAAAHAGCASIPSGAPGSSGGGTVAAEVPVPAPEGAIAPPDPFAALAEQQRREAAALSKGGPSRKALEKWRVVAALAPDDAGAGREVAALEKALRESADSHFHRGQAYLREKKVKAARRELLLALTKNPDHREALTLLKEGLDEEMIVYTVEEGDTPGIIAEKLYGNSEALVIIARLHELKEGEELEEGRTLRLPLHGVGARDPGPGGEGKEQAAAVAPAAHKELNVAAVAEIAEAYLEESEPGPQTETVMARAYLEAGSFEKALDTVETIPAGESPEEEILEIVNASYYGLGKKLYGEKRYGEALTALGEADPDYRDTASLIAAVEKARRDEAETHYLAGVRFFIDEKLAEAIAEWEKTLALDPGHSKAGKDLKKARTLSEELKKIR